MKVLVTGGAGFIGSHLVNDLAARGERVTVVDNLSTGRRDNITAPNVTVYIKDVQDTPFMHALLKRGHFDYIYYLAAIASVAVSIKQPALTHAVDNDAVLDTLEYLRTQRLKIQQFVFASSAAVYGNLPELPKREDSRVAPVSPYAIDKYATERYALVYGRLYQLPTVCVRFFNVYGPHQDARSPYSGVLALLTHCLATNQPFIEYGDGSQTRDFIYVEDVVAALLLLRKVGKHTVYNVANGREISLKQIIARYELLTQRHVAVIQRPARRGDIRYSVADIHRLQALGYQPQWSLERGLAQYWGGVPHVG